MCLMLERSKISLKKAKDALETFEICNGEAWLDSACFDTQQAMEFLLKGILLGYGVKFESTHNIDYLITLLDDKTTFTFTKHDDLMLLATTITSWEEGSRYGKGIKTSVNTVRRIHNIYNNILETFIKIQETNQLTIANEINDTQKPLD